MLWLDVFCRSFVEDAFVWVVQEWDLSTESRICMVCLKIVGPYKVHLILPCIEEMKSPTIQLCPANNLLCSRSRHCSSIFLPEAARTLKRLIFVKRVAMSS